ncbi:MAG: ATP-binding protein [Methanomicrobiales archaeon]
MEHILSRVLEGMGVPAGEIQSCSALSDGAVAAHFDQWSPHEVYDLVETLVYISICQQAPGGVSEEDCFAHTTGPIFALLHGGLATRTGRGRIRTTDSGEVIAATVRRARVAELDIDHLSSRVPLAVPVLLSCRTWEGGVMKTVPPGPGEGLEAVARHSPLLQSAFLRFARLLEERGAAVRAGPAGETGERYVCVPELPYILREVISRCDERLVDRATALFDEAGRIEATAAHLRGERKVTGEEVRELVRSWLSRMDTVAWTGSPTRMGEVPFIISDPNAFRREIEALHYEAMDRLAGEFTAILSEYGAPPAERGDMGAAEIDDAPVLPDTGGDGDLSGAPEAEGEEEIGPPDGDMDEEPPASPTPPPVSPVPPPTGACRIFLGHDHEGGEVWWNPGALNNGHMILIGGSGAGKTETIRCISQEICGQGIPVVMIDFHGDMASGGTPTTSYRIREGSAQYFNPFELDPAVEEISPLRATSDFVDAISINFPTLGIQQRRRIKSIIKDCYRRAGITSDPATWEQQLDCTMLEAEILNCEDETIPAYLEDIFDYRLFAGDEKISISRILAGHITHLNLNALPENLRYLFADLFLRRLYYSLQAMGEIPRNSTSDREKFRLFVIVDEAKLLVSQKTGSKQTIRAVLNKYATEMRKFGVGLILASQLIGHFNSEILANIAVKFCMRTENKKQALENARFFEVSEEELMGFPPGGGILVVGTEKKAIQVVPSHLRTGQD